MRRRPVGAVIADICRDLGIVPGHLNRAFWDEISLAIIVHGGSHVRFIFDPSRRMLVHALSEILGRTRDGWPTPPTGSPAPATGPP